MWFTDLAYFFLERLRTHLGSGKSQCCSIIIPKSPPKIMVWAILSSIFSTKNVYETLFLNILRGFERELRNDLEDPGITSLLMQDGAHPTPEVFHFFNGHSDDKSLLWIIKSIREAAWI